VGLKPHANPKDQGIDLFSNLRSPDLPQKQQQKQATSNGKKFSHFRGVAMAKHVSMDTSLGMIVVENKG
jgi:hypothetical protein